MPKRKNKQQLRPFAVTFESHRAPNKVYHEPIFAVDVNVMAASVEDALTVASREAIGEFIDRKPSWAAKVCWSRDQFYEGCGYISGRAPRGGERLSAPYHLTKRLKATVTLGRLPIQLELDFNQ